MKLLCIILGFSCFLFSCKTSDLKNQSTDVENSGIASASESQVLTLILEFVLNPNNMGDEISLVHKVLSEGKLKKEERTLNISDRYQVAFVDTDDKELRRISFPDPLRKKMEHSNESGELGMTDVTLEKDAVAIRLNYYYNLSQIKLYEQKELELTFLKAFEISL